LNFPAVDVDIVVGVPESSVPAAMGYAKQCGVPYCEGIIKNRYSLRMATRCSDALTFMSCVVQICAPNLYPADTDTKRARSVNEIYTSFR
jgi:hypothetical protein